jgi:hypothetical protein
MHSYASYHQDTLPPAAVCGADGRPLLSWRVLILPYIEQDELYQQFHLDEPWDSPHNRALLPRMPATYAAPGRKASRLPAHHTVCHVFVGPGAAFEGREGLHLRHDFPDGISNTLLVVEAGEPVPWTAPWELAFAPDRPLPPLPGLFRTGIRAAMADGSLHWIPTGASERFWRARITRNGNEDLDSDRLP